MKKVLAIHDAPPQHWVGDGFRVSTLFSWDTFGEQASPFLMLDYAAPADFAPAEKPRGVGVHPHRGFETVTLVYQGELQHRDSSGGGGLIGPGDVQWMTAAAGILHDEFHSAAFTRAGGTLEMVQLWVNLPARHKLAAPGYQTLRAGDIARIPLDNAAGSLRLIAGEFAGQRGPARTFTPMDVWELQLQPGTPLWLPVCAGQNVLLLLLRGSVQINAQQQLNQGQLALLERDGDQLQLQAASPALLLLLSGAPIDEPIAGWGPFVMNNQSELEQALQDFRSGNFGQLAESRA
jgi:redox-sensitive bicupin YhaK (pirin superfamily)